MMSILNYFSEVDERYPGRKLPCPGGLLSRQVPASAISSANYRINDASVACQMPEKVAEESTKNSALRRRLKSEREQLNVE